MHKSVYRAFEPNTVFLSWEGKVKLLNPGPAHFFTKRSPSAYIAPELWRGAGQDERTDVWALGVMLYEMLTGRLPFPSATLAELRSHALSPEPVPSVREHCPELPLELDALMAAALAKDPARRIPDAMKFQRELQSLAKHLGIELEVPRPAASHHRQVTLMSCELSSPSEPGAQPLDPEDMNELETIFQDCRAEIIQQYRGTWNLGTGIAYFGHQRDWNAHAERAVRAGLLLSSRFREIIRRKRPELLESRVEVKIGIHTAFMALNERRSSSMPIIQENAEAVARWLMRQASPGEVLLGDTTWQLVHEAIELAAFGDRPFEGWLSVLPMKSPTSHSSF